MEMEVQLPRLTRYLRAFTGLEPRKQHGDNAISKPHVSKNENKPLERTDFFLWSDLLKIIEEHSCMTPGVTKNFKYLQNLANDICESQFIVGETAIYLFQLFMVKQKTLKKHSLTLKRIYSNISYSQIDKICAVVKNIVDELSEECITAISEKFKKPIGRESFNGNINSSWGDHLRFNFPLPWTPPDTSFLSDLCQGQNAINTFSMVYNETGTSEKKGENKKNFGKVWLLKEVEKCCNNSNGLTTEDICNSIINLLTSQRTNDALQNELFDFLGFDNFEFIQLLLEHRKEICMNNKLVQERKNIGTDKEIVLSVTKVPVKSVEEICMEKQARKEKIQLTKIAAKEEPCERFDPVEHSTTRIAALTSPIRNGFISENEKDSIKKKKLPDVCDSLNASQLPYGAMENENWIQVKKKEKRKGKKSNRGEN